MIVGRVWSLNKPRKWDKVNLQVLVGSRLGKLRSSTQVGYHPTFSTEGDALGKVVGWNGNVDCQSEEGTPIRITHRYQAKNVVSNYMIADTNIRGYLKPKGKIENEWCRYCPYQRLTKVLVRSNLKIWRWGHLTE